MEGKIISYDNNLGSIKGRKAMKAFATFGRIFMNRHVTKQNKVSYSL